MRLRHAHTFSPCFVIVLLIVLLLLLLLLLLTLGCSKEPPLPTYSYDPEVNVFALLILNNQQKIVRVERSYKATDYFPEQRGIPDATVFVNDDTAAVQFLHQGNGVYQDVDGRLLLAAGKHYRLDITLANGKKLTARCTQPGRPTIQSPMNNSTVEAFKFLSIEWGKADFAYRYLVYLNDTSRDFTLSDRTDSTGITFYPFLFAEPDVYVIKVVAAEPNYYDYLRGRPEDEPMSLVSGGLGVFGAVAYDEIVVVAR